MSIILPKVKNWYHRTHIKWLNYRKKSFLFYHYLPIKFISSMNRCITLFQEYKIQIHNFILTKEEIHVPVTKTGNIVLNFSLPSLCRSLWYRFPCPVPYQFVCPTAPRRPLLHPPPVPHQTQTKQKSNLWSMYSAFIFF